MITASDKFRWVRRRMQSKVGRKNGAYPTVSPTPFCLSTPMSSDSSPVLFSTECYTSSAPHDELPLRGCPIRVLDENRKLVVGIVSNPTSRPTRTPYHLFVRHLIVHALVCCRHEGVHHDQNAVLQAAKRKVGTEYVRS